MLQHKDMCLTDMRQINKINLWILRILQLMLQPLRINRDAAKSSIIELEKQFTIDKIAEAVHLAR